MTIGKLYNKIKTLNIDKVINQALRNTADDLEDVNRERMSDGVLADGQVLPHYSYISQTVYGYPDIPIAQKATGAFQAAIKVTVNSGVIKTDSTDSKAAMLEAKYGKANNTSVFGTSGEYKKQYIKESLRPEFRNRLKAVTGL